MTRPELADCGHALPDFPVFTEQHAYCTAWCREWMEPETTESEESEESEDAVR